MAREPRSVLEPWMPAVRRVRLETRCPAVLTTGGGGLCLGEPGGPDAVPGSQPRP